MDDEKGSGVVPDEVLNCRGMNCPLPIIQTRKTLAKMDVGQIIQIVATDPGSVEDMTEFTRGAGHALLSHREELGDFIFFVRKAAAG